jgi:1,4-alpha-glucan branching enzyme
VSAVDELVEGRLADPHSLLGAHAQNGSVVVRAFRPEAESVRVRVEGAEPVELERAHPAGLFEGKLDGAEVPLRYRLEVSYSEGATLVVDDP